MLAATPGAESWQAYLDRSGRALMDVASRHEGRRILVIAHGETSASAMHTFMRLPVGASRWTFPHINHTALSGWRRKLFGDNGIRQHRRERDGTRQFVAGEDVALLLSGPQRRDVRIREERADVGIALGAPQ